MAREIYEGMTVRGPDGDKLGKIKEIGEGYFVYEKGLLNKERHRVAFGELIDVRDGDAIVPVAATGAAAPAAGREAAAGGRAAAARGSEAEVGEVRVPLKEERIETGKRMREAGRLQVTKHVETEQRHFTVPVRHEEVHVERVAARGDVPAGDAGFTEETISVPIREEEVEIRKRPVVREEVRVTKGMREGEREITEPVRREVAEVHTEGRVEGERGRREPDRES